MVVLIQSSLNKSDQIEELKKIRRHWLYKLINLPSALIKCFCQMIQLNGMQSVMKGKSVVLLFACISVLVLAITLNEDLSESACIDKFEYTPTCVSRSVELPPYFQSSWLLKNTEAQKVQPSCRGKGW